MRRILLTVLRVALAVLALLACYRLNATAANSGYARLLSMLAIIGSSVEPSDAAVTVAPSDPETHYTRALELVNVDRLDEAVAELREAIRLRPHHYYQWLDLGVTLDRLKDEEGALTALRQSVRLAPAFAQPRWQLGNLLYRQRKYDEAFAELRRGAGSSRGLFDSLLDLAWVAANGDAAVMDSLVQPQTSGSHLALANFLAKHGKGVDAVRHVRQAGVSGDTSELRLQQQTVLNLISTNQFSDAFVAWSLSHPAYAGDGISGQQFLNPDFSKSISRNDPGFGWQFGDIPQVSIAIDPVGPTRVSRSICVEFNGEYAPGAQVLSQLILVRPRTHYSVTFMARSDGLVSAGLPVVEVFDSNNTTLLAKSKPLAPGNNDWSPQRIDFSTDDKTQAVIVSLQRIPCDESPCPIFGKIWLSQFSTMKS